MIQESSLKTAPENFDDWISQTVRNAVRGALAEYFSEKEVKSVPEPSKYATQPQVEKAFSVSKQTVYNWTKKGILHPAKIGGRVLYLWDEIHALIEANRSQKTR